MTTDARLAMIEDHLYLVWTTRQRMVPCVPAAIDVEDLEAVGRMALVRAVDRYRPDRGTRFTTWAIACIRGAMLEYLRSQDVLTRHDRQHVKRLEVTRRDYHAAHGTMPDDEQIAAAAGVTVDKVQRWQALARLRFLSLEQEHVGDEDPDPLTVADVAADRNPDPETIGLEAWAASRLWAEVRRLRLRVARVLVRYYQDNMPLREIAREIGISESRAYQLKDEGLTMLRQRLTP